MKNGELPARPTAPVDWVVGEIDGYLVIFRKLRAEVRSPIVGLRWPIYWRRRDSRVARPAGSTSFSSRHPLPRIGRELASSGVHVGSLDPSPLDVTS